MQTDELRRPQQVRLAVQALAIAAREVPRAARGPRKGGSRALFDVPTGPLAVEADALARRSLSTEVYLHSVRCWQWARHLVAIDGLRVDEDALFVACMLHDIGLGADAHPTACCFCALGGERAEALCIEHAEPARGAAARHAIARHFDPVADPAPEARALHDAAHLDVVGYRAREVELEFARAVVEHAPRTNFRRAFIAGMRQEARVRPRSVAATMWKAGLLGPLLLNPLDRL